MAKKVVFVVLLVVLAAFAARALIYPAVMQNTSISPTINQGETMLISRIERFTNQPFKRFEVVAVIPPFVSGRAYNLVESPLSVFAELTGIPVAPTPTIEFQRVIALPGETVVIRKDLGVFIDGKLLDETSYTKDMPHSDLFVLADIVRETLEEGGLLQSYENSEAPIVVPNDMVFVLPDDRKDFRGSNEWGFLPQTRVVGKVEYKLAKKGFEAVKTPAVKFATEKIAINDDGVRALENGEYTKAIHLFKSALAVDNNFELARDNLSIAYNNFAIQSVNKPGVALDSLHKALFLDPDNQLTQKNLAGILKRMGKDASKYEDRIELAQDALKHHKTISALVEYRAAVKLHPSPTALAKVSMLEAQCNFPPHAIPEDLVTATVDNTAAIATTGQREKKDKTSAPSTESRLAFGDNIAGVAATKIDLKQSESAKKPSEKNSTVSAASQASALKAFSKHLGKAVKDNKDDKKETQISGDNKEQESKKTSKKKTESKDDDKVLSSKDGNERVSKEKLSTDKVSSALTSKNSKSKKEQKVEEPEKSESKTVAHSTREKSSKDKAELKEASERRDETAAKAKSVAKDKSEAIEKSGAEHEKIASKNLDTSTEELGPIQRQPLKQTSNGFDLGSFMKNLVSSFSTKNPNSSEVEVTPEGYRGPPRVKEKSSH